MPAQVHTRFRNDMLWLILDHAETNVLTLEMLDQLTTVLQRALKLSPRLVVLAGAGEQAFSVGSEAKAYSQAHAGEMLLSMTTNCAAFAALHAQQIPTVALVKGLALGTGCELAALCETILAHENARFGLPGISQGILSPVAAAYFPKILGYQTTMRLMLTGEKIGAEEALRLGLVHQVLSASRFLSDAEELLSMLAATHQRIM